MNPTVLEVNPFVANGNDGRQLWALTCGAPSLITGEIPGAVRTALRSYLGLSRFVSSYAVGDWAVCVDLTDASYGLVREFTSGLYVLMEETATIDGWPFTLKLNPTVVLRHIQIGYVSLDDASATLRVPGLDVFNQVITETHANRSSGVQRVQRSLGAKVVLKRRAGCLAVTWRLGVSNTLAAFTGAMWGASSHQTLVVPRLELKQPDSVDNT